MVEDQHFNLDWVPGSGEIINKQYSYHNGTTFFVSGDNIR